MQIVPTPRLEQGETSDLRAGNNEAKNVFAAGVCGANGLEGEVPLLVRDEEELET